VFAGIDSFGRIVDQHWQNHTGSTPGADLDRYKYGYDYNSNRQWKQNTVGAASDEYHTCAALNWLTEMQGGAGSPRPPRQPDGDGQGSAAARMIGCSRSRDCS
jgi:hypothetical protein